MKKLITILMFVLSSFFLSGCQINLGAGESIDVPWWFALLFVTVPLVIVFSLIGYFSIPERVWFTCPKCGTTFLKKRKELVFVLGKFQENSGSAVLKCPSCGEKNDCVVSYDQDR